MYVRFCQTSLIYNIDSLSDNHCSYRLVREKQALSNYDDDDSIAVEEHQLLRKDRKYKTKIVKDDRNRDKDHQKQGEGSIIENGSPSSLPISQLTIKWSQLQ